MAARKVIYNSMMAIALWVAIVTSVSAQQISKDSLAKLTASIDTFRNNRPIEKLYLQFDRPYYTIGDTIWFKAYLLNSFLTPSLKSNMLYIELANDHNYVVKRMLIAVAYGSGWGNMVLNKKEIPEGGYTLHAYTNWMRNFADDYVFTRTFYFGNPADNWLAKTKFKLLAGNDADSVQADVQFNKLNGLPLALTDLELQVSDGKTNMYKSKAETKLDGSVGFNFALKHRAKQITLITSATDKEKVVHQLQIPVTLNRPENIDLQFMPEGGNLVAGLPLRVAFKAIGENGESVEVSGDVYNTAGQRVASFKSAYKGMGKFALVPKAGEAYTAKITLPVATVKTYNLPSVKTDGSALQISDVQSKDSLLISVTSTQQNGNYYLLGQSRGVICYTALVALINHAARSKVSIGVFPSGIARFTLFNAGMQPVNERIVFINHHDNLQITIQPGQQLYNTRDSIAIGIHAADVNGKAAIGTFSVAITDGNLVKTDSLADDMISNLLLTADLKGGVESPAYYFHPDTSGIIKRQLDNLMLTQGWVGYDWKEVLFPAKPMAYPAETAFAIKGVATNLFNKPVQDLHISAFSRKPFMIKDTVTDKYGRFEFNGIIPVDTPVFILQARTKNNKNAGVNLTVDEFKPPLFSAPAQLVMPWYVNSDTSSVNLMRSAAVAKTELEKPAKGVHQLKEVVVSANKFVKGSQNRNGPGNADVVLDESDLEKAGKKTLLQLLQENVKSFATGTLDVFGVGPSSQDAQLQAAFLGIYGAAWYFVKGIPIKFIIDGIPYSDVYGYENLAGMTNYLKSHSAEEIRGVEVSSSAKYTMKYVPVEWGESLRINDIAFVEITTRASTGPVISRTPGSYLYKPLPFSPAKQFYSPRYTVTNRDTVAISYRPTIYWKPNIATDKDGNAVVWFYAGDKKGTYTLILEGADANGNIGNIRQRIKIGGQ